MKKTLNIIGNVVLTILIMLLIGYGWAFFEIKILLKSNPELFGYVFYQQKTNDMAPDFIEDDIIIIKKNESYSRGDRVFYLNEDSEFNIHTVMAVDSVATTTKCNTCLENNKPVDNSAVIGRVVGKIMYFGKFINFFKQKWLLTTLAISGFLCVVISQYVGETPVKKVASKK